MRKHEISYEILLIFKFFKLAVNYISIQIFERIRNKKNRNFKIIKCCGLGIYFIKFFLYELRNVIM